MAKDNTEKSNQEKENITKLTGEHEETASIIDESPHDIENDHGSEKITIHESTVLKALTLQFIDSSKRSRSALIVLLLIALILSVAAFNYRSSWLFTHDYRAHEIHRNEELKSPINPLFFPNYEYALVEALNRESENTIPEYKRNLYHEVFDGVFKTVDVPAIGLEIYIEDLPLLGSFGLSIALLWFYFVRRRERGILKVIRRKVELYSRMGNSIVVEYLYHSVSFNQVFNEVDDIDDYQKTPYLADAYPYLRRYFEAIIYLPLVVLTLVFAYDTYETYFWKSPLLVPDEAKIVNSENFDRSVFEADPHNYMSNLLQPYRDSIQKEFVHTIEFIRADSLSSDYEKREKLIYQSHLLQEEKDKLEKQYYRRASLIEFIHYRHDQYEEMNSATLRFIPDIIWEIIVLRTIVPILFILWCYYLSRVIHKMAKNRDTHYNEIQQLYKLGNSKSS